MRNQNADFSSVSFITLQVRKHLAGHHHIVKARQGHFGPCPCAPDLPVYSVIYTVTRTSCCSVLVNKHTKATASASKVKQGFSSFFSFT